MVAALAVYDNDEEMDESDRLLRAQLRARVGTVVRGKWRLDSLLGVGGMAAVYAASHRNGHPCALKMLLPAYASNADVVQRFLKEGYVANDVSHPGVVTVTDDDVTEDGTHFLVMELLQGESFDQFLRGHPGGLDAHESMRVADAVLDVLEAAHARGVIHRDVKPENIFLLRDGRVKLLDFGIARARHAGASTPAATQHGAVMGTPSFMPPEQARGYWDQVDAQSDVWAVGAVMYVALTGTRLRNAATTNEELLQAMTVPAPPLLTVAPVASAVPSALADVVDRALAFDRGTRWPSARAMQTALRAVMGEDAPTLHQPSRPPSSTLALPGAPPGPGEATDATQAPLGTAIGLTRSHAPSPTRADAGPRKTRAPKAALGAAGLALCGALAFVALHATPHADTPDPPPTAAATQDGVPPVAAPSVEPAAAHTTSPSPSSSGGPSEPVAASPAPSAPPSAVEPASPERPRGARAPAASPRSERAAPTVQPTSVATVRASLGVATSTTKPAPAPTPSFDPLDRRR